MDAAERVAFEGTAKLCIKGRKATRETARRILIDDCISTEAGKVAAE